MFQIFRLDGGKSERNMKLPLARLKDSKEIMFFPNNISGSVWEYNEIQWKLHTPSDPPTDWKNNWKEDLTIEITCSRKSRSF